MLRPELPFSFCLFILLTLFSLSALGDQSSQEQLTADYEQLLTKTLQERYPPLTEADIALDDFLQQLSRAKAKELDTSLIKPIFHYGPQLEGYVDTQHFASLPTVLLSYGLENMARHFLQTAEQGASEYGLARVRLAFADHYVRSSRWDDAIQELSRIAIDRVLDPADADHAYLVYGFALQGKRQHREAVDYYKRIGVDSPHYPLAQLNIALAYLRQDWWTDAEIAIQAALSASDGQLDDTSDRLYTVLGFSQIQHGFYRRARDTFRKVRVDSDHANRALLGLGIAALHQQDLVAALNAFEHLKTRGRYELSVAESYLLSPFTLSRIQNTTSASAAYAETIAFYQHYLAAIEHQSNTISERLEDKIRITPEEFRAITAMISSAEAMPLKLWFQRLQNLEAVMSSDNTEADALLEEINIRIGHHASEALARRQAIIESYLNQAQFGLATLYDSK